MGQALSRSEAREVAYRIVFAGGDLEEVLPMALGDKFAPAPELNFIKHVVQAVRDNLATIDQKITANLQDWTLDRLRKTDLAALRLGIAELLLGEVPVAVVINEAVTLAKKYGDAQSGAFVNGVLAKLVA